MRFVDARLDPSLRTDEDLDNLAYFDVETALLVMPQAARFSTADDVLEAFHALDAEAARVGRFGIRPLMCLGIGAEQVPTRTHLEVFTALHRRAAAGHLHAVGRLDAFDTVNAERHIALAADHGLPIVFDAAHFSSRQRVESAVQVAIDGGVPASRIVFDGCDYLAIRAVREVGAIASLDLAPNGMSVDAVSLVERYGASLLRQVIFSSAGGASVDVLALAKARRALETAGYDPGLIEAACRDNALAVFDRAAVARMTS